MVNINEADKQFIQHPNMWNHWPFLPMRKEETAKQKIDLRIGVLLESGEPKWQSIIYLDVNIFEVGDISKAAKQEYESIEAMQADGWVVD